MFKLIPLTATLMLSSSYGFASVASPDWATCVANLQHTAKEQGVLQSTIDHTLANVKFVPKVIELDGKQPEFSASFD